MKNQSEAIPLFFAFPDGVYHYICSECSALCCRGQGFDGNLRREMRTLLSLYPPLESMAVSQEGELVSFVTPAGRCYFLDDDNLCRIEKEHGKSLKPGVCTLFPFNLFTRIGNTIAVSPHLLCPLRLAVPPRPGQVEGTHSLIEAAVRHSALLEPASLQVDGKSAHLHPSKNAVLVLEREAKFRAACSQALGKRTFADTLMQGSANPGELKSVVERAVKVMGLATPPSPRGHDEIDDLMLALASPFRLQLLQLSSDAILCALALGELVVRRASLLSSRPLSAQGAYSIMAGTAPMIRLLARGDEPLDLPRYPAPKVPPFGDPDLTFAAFAVLRQAQASGSILQALETAIGPVMGAAGRSVLLVQLGSQLEHARSRRRKKADSK